MSFRRRLTLGAVAAVAAAVLLASGAAYLLVRTQLLGELDDSLTRAAQAVSALPSLAEQGAPAPRPRPDGLGGPLAYAQVLSPEGTVLEAAGRRPRLPLDARARRMARGDDAPFFVNVRVDGEEVRILTTPLPGGGALQLARSLEEVNSVLASIRAVLGAMVLLGIGLAVLLGRFVAHTALAPVQRLTEASEHVAATRELSHRIETRGDDELGRLAGSFNTMLDALQDTVAALDRSLVAQRRLVADASHELRTPLTSLRTNVEVLRDGDGHSLPGATRHELHTEVIVQVDELTHLVGDLIDLARDGEAGETQDVRLDSIVAEALERFDRDAKHLRFERRLEPTALQGRPDRLARAVANLLDNAAKFSPPGGVVEVALRRGELTVRDRGPGIDAADLPHVFDRFYRSARARSVPGSGLGLAIVRQVVESHGGQVSAQAAPGGGTVMRMRLPTAAPLR